MKIKIAAASIAAALMLPGSPALAQTSASTKVTTGTSMSDGVATTKTKVTHTVKHKTRRPKKILGVKVGHKTAVTKTVRTTSTSTDGSHSTTVKTTH